MNPSGDYNHQQGADYGSGHYRPELGGDDIEVKHESYTGRYEEEAQVDTASGKKPSPLVQKVKKALQEPEEGASEPKEL